MSFIVDNQTLSDLAIFGKGRSSRSVSALFGDTRTSGGAAMLERMFREPLSDMKLIKERQEAVRYFLSGGAAPDFNSSDFAAAAYYISNDDPRSEIVAGKRRNILQAFVKEDSGTQELRRGYEALRQILSEARGFCASLAASADYEPLRSKASAVSALIDSLGPESATDRTLRFERRSDVVEIMDFLHAADVFSTVARVAARRGFSLPEILPAEENVFEAEGAFHPLLEAPVPVDVSMDGDVNVLFLTGANMSGKSTFMKTFGILAYLAHLGFPVPAAKLRISLRNGLFSSVNLADNLAMGYSHFYSEVRRLKKVASAAGRYGHVIAIFDELFRGTNVKDAYDATLAVTEAFAKVKGSIFLISTHITEAGETLRERGTAGIEYRYLPSVIEGNTPRYSYRLTEGIATGRYGMTIIQNEHILDILKKNGADN